MNAGPGERGVALVLSLIVLLSLTALVVAFMSLSSLEPSIARNLRDAAQARWLAEAGVEVGYNTLTAAGAPDGSWTDLLSSVTPEAPWATLPGLEGPPPPGLGPPGGVWAVSIRNDTASGDAASTGVPPESDAARDGNGVVVLRSTALVRRAARAIEVVVRREGVPGAGAESVGVRARHAMSNWREP